MPSGPAPSGPRWLGEREQAAWRAYLDMSAQLATQLNRDLQLSTGLSSPDFSVLVQLSEHPDGRLRVLELARALRWEKSRLSHQLTRMQRRGLIERSDCAGDRRGAFVVLSDTGRATVERAAPEHVESVRRYLFDALTPQQVDDWATVSRLVVERIAESGATCAPECPGDDDAPDGPADSCG